MGDETNLICLFSTWGMFHRWRKSRRKNDDEPMDGMDGMDGTGYPIFGQTQWGFVASNIWDTLW